MTADFDILSLTDSVEQKLRELEVKLADPAAPGSPNYADMLREHGAFSKVVVLRNEIIDVRNRIAENEELAGEEDEEIAELAKEELPELTAKHEALLVELEQRMLLDDKDSSRNCIIEIRAGTGGNEAAIFVGDLFRMYIKYAEMQRWKVEVLESHPTEHDGFKEIIFSLQGQEVYAKMRYEGGGHRVQRVPVTESQGRIHTSAATVAVLPEVDEVEVDINPTEIRIDTFAASGPGGQHVNRTMSAVRITHLPTSIVVSCQDERSQHKNKARCLRILRSRLYDAALQEQDRERSEVRRAMIGSGDRSDRIRTYNFPQNRITDHRAEITLYSLDRAMEGEIVPLISALMEADRRRKLEELVKDPTLLTRK